MMISRVRASPVKVMVPARYPIMYFGAILVIIPNGLSVVPVNNNPGDRRFIFSSGPFVLIPGAVNNITFGCIWAPQPVGGCPWIPRFYLAIRNIDDQAQALFDNDFKTVEGPEAPRLTCVELDRKLVFYLVNDPVSNNYGENYGRNDGSYADSTRYHQRAIKSIGSRNPNDSLYKFEGYRVFQLANGLTSSAGIINQGPQAKLTPR